jgi:hypothetical protein
MIMEWQMCSFKLPAWLVDRCHELDQQGQLVKPKKEIAEISFKMTG